MPRSVAIAVGAAGLVVVGSLATLVALHAATGGAFLYTLDDPYIHLQLARTLALHGVYGLHAEEVSAPSSSILWPFLLLPAAGSAWLEAWPYILALAASAAAPALAALLADAAMAARGGDGRLRVRAALGLAAVTLAATNPFGLPFTGMEQSLQALLAVAAALGLVLAVARDRVPRWLIVVLMVAPLVRFESASITLACGLVLLLRGHRAAAVAAVGGAALGIGAFAAFLLAQGLDPLPSSVIEKSFIESGWLAGRLFAHLEARWYAPMWGVLALPLALLVVARTTRTAAARETAPLLGAALLVVTAHVATGGRYHWGARYEVYVFAFVLPLLAWRLATTAAGGASVRAGTGALALVAAPVAAAYLWHGALTAPAQAAAIGAQPAQLARFVAGFWRRPVAVNDIGLVALRGGVRVLDLVGLSSRDIRRARARGDGEATRAVAAAVERMRIGAALYYPHWVGSYRPDSWITVATLVTTTTARNLGGSRVAIDATDAASVPALVAALAAFEAGLPAQTVLEWRVARPR